ncbi:hypothetical protein [Streptomyces sp. AC1-42T]|uniref:hypothetical protein n=1 Tax=unclassified Streptomyces TaxID=2593676 RepID=UPI002686D396
MEIRQLRHFMAVITHGGFTTAARAELFERTGRRVVLTEAGRAALPAARTVLLVGRAPRPRNPAAAALLGRLGGGGEGGAGATA